MIRLGRVLSAGAIATAMAAGVFVSAQVYVPEPRRGSGASITGAFEGWYYNPDGSRSFLVGYYNRNAQQAPDISIGPNNRIEPGGPDMGQPTHFLPGRQWGMFTIPVPRDFKETDSYVWTLVANGVTNSIPLRLHPDYVMAPFREIAVGNTPPIVRFDQNAQATVQGPRANLAAAPVRTATVATPFPFTIWLTDDMKFTSGTSAPPSASRQPVLLTVSQYRGPAGVTIDKPRPTIEKLAAGEGSYSGKATATVTFKEPGDYALHVIANDYSGDGGGGFGCCWTTAVVKISVKP